LPSEAPPLRTFYLYVSGGCNLNCRHCWISPEFDPGASRSRFLDLSILEKALEEALPLGLRSVKLTGGEPMLHPDFAGMVRLLAARGLTMHMETNGTLLDAASARLMRETGLFRTISVSLDGATGPTHDAMRRVQGSFDRALEGIRALVSEGFRPQVICTLHEGNAAEALPLVSLARSMGCGSVKFNNVQVVGRGSGMPGRLSLRALLDLHTSIRAGAAGGTDPRFRVVFDIPPAFRPVGELLEGGASACRILNILGILPGGELAMCGIGTAYPELVYGRLPGSDVREVWAGSPGLRELRSALPGSLTAPCSGCIHRDACMGVCAAGNYHRTGRLDSSYWFCEEAWEEGLFPSSRLLGTPRR